MRDLSWAQILPAVTGLLGVVIGSLIQLGAGIWIRRETAIQSWEEKSIEARRAAYGAVLSQIATIQWLLVDALGHDSKSEYWTGKGIKDFVKRFEAELTRARDLLFSNSLLLSEEFIDAYIAMIMRSDTANRPPHEQAELTLQEYRALRHELEKIARSDLLHPSARKRLPKSRPVAI